MARIILNNQPLESAVITTDFENNVVDFINDWNKGRLVYHIYTSGTTGKPKKCTFTREQLIKSAELTAKTFDLSAGKVLFTALSPEYVAGMMMLVRGLHLNMDLIISEPTSNPFKKLADEFKQQIDFTALVPIQIQSILHDPSSFKILNNCKTIIIGGGALSAGLELDLRSFSGETCFYHTYAMTETLTHVAVRPINHNPSEFYTALEGVELDVDERQCLIVKSPINNMNPLITNDVVELGAGKKEFKWQGRFDDVINSGGYKVHPQFVESIIEKHVERMLKENTPYFISGIPDEKLGQKVGLFVEWNGEPINIENFKLLLKQDKDLHPYQIPKEIIELSAFDRTESGKVKRKEIVRNYLEG